jgi:hypothetical protein
MRGEIRREDKSGRNGYRGTCLAGLWLGSLGGWVTCKTLGSRGITKRVAITGKTTGQVFGVRPDRLLPRGGRFHSPRGDTDGIGANQAGRFLTAI